MSGSISWSRPLTRWSSSRPAPEQAQRIGQHIAGLVEDGDCIQIGIGKMPASVLAALHGHKELGLHGGMVTDEVIDLHAAGALNTMVCCTALGSRVYGWSATRDDLRFAPVSYTHDVRVLAHIDRFVAINSVLAVDLFGQANAEMLHGRQVSGTGGLMDFVRGARLSRGGRSILALPSSAGGASRILSRLDQTQVVSLPRADADIVVTEHRTAHLRDKSIDERAQALIAIADPTARDQLANAWDALRAKGAQ